MANIYWRTSPSNSIEGSADKVDFNTWAMDAKVPVVLSDKLTLLPGFELTNNRISNSTDNWIFSSTTLQLGAEMKWTDKFNQSLYLLQNSAAHSQVALIQKIFNLVALS
ncbi:MAG: hypothetical protein IPO32_10205 [Crocinitomicaceae bacterium]|nr:hypothetical protein [Crocinitomicaceae bacterium]